MLPVGGPVTLRVDVQAPDTARIDLMKDGDLLQWGAGATLERVVDADAAVYRTEIVLPGTPGEPPVPWMVSNPIYVGRDPADAAPSDTRPRTAHPHTGCSA